MKKLYNTLFLNNRLFIAIGAIALLCVLGFFASVFLSIAKVFLFVLFLLTLVDVFLLYLTKNGAVAERQLPERLSNGDENKITVQLKNRYKFKTYTSLIEELPYQFQQRDFIFKEQLKVGEEKTLHYNVIPKKRGEYNFGEINLYVSTPLQLATKKYVLGAAKKVKCYPSFLKLREFNIKAFTNSVNAVGTRKTRRIGHSLEFEQIKEYVSGDDVRTLNWKATAKRNQFMVNQYVEEKSQPVYAIIDKGRAMQMHFNGLTLLDYAVNATLAICNIILRKQDKAGMLTFSKKLEDLIVAEQRNTQMNLISESLYNVHTDFHESDYSLLYATIKRKITHRSLLILFTNFETMDSLKRQLPYLRAIAKNHLLLVVFFKNTELNKIINKKSETVLGVYDTIIAEKFMLEKKQIVNELKKYGIQSVLTKPEELTSETMNKYLEFKSRGLF